MNVFWLILAAILAVNVAVLPYFAFLLATALAAILTGRELIDSSAPSSKLLIVIPAHDEEAGVAMTVRSCRESRYPSLLFGVVVIADNCTDRTAALARHAGARVVERFDDVKKSKGYAIEYLLGSLERSGELGSLDAVVIIDADTTIDPNLLSKFDQSLRRGHDWVQAYYTVANPGQSWRTRLMTYAFSLFNGVMQLGQIALGSSAGFKGNGMCLSTRGLHRWPWRSYGLVEDMEYSWALRVAGEKIWFEPDAVVYGAMVSSGGQAAATQRRRWEFGRADIRKKYLGPLLRSKELAWLEKAISACELTVPSMALLALIYLCVVAIDAFALFALAGSQFAIARGIVLGFWIFLTVALAAYAISPFLAMRLPLKYIGSLFFFPVYVFWKLLVSLGGRPQQWVRTGRERQQT